jgi:hypothetical protein
MPAYKQRTEGDCVNFADIVVIQVITHPHQLPERR